MKEKGNNAEFYQAIGNSIQANKEKIEKLEKQNARLKKKNKKLKDDNKRLLSLLGEIYEENNNLWNYAHSIKRAVLEED